MSLDCLNPVELDVSVPDKWYLTPFRQFVGGFMGSHIVWDSSTGRIMAGLGVLQMVLCAIQVIRLGQRLKEEENCNQEGGCQLERHDDKIKFKTNTLDRWSPLAGWIWQFWLGLLFVSTPIWGMSGASMGATFFHALAEFSLMIMRLKVLIGNPTVCCRSLTSYLDVITIGIFFALLTVLEVLLDNPIYKAIVAGIPAGPSDIGNLIVVWWLVVDYKRFRRNLDVRDVSIFTLHQYIRRGHMYLLDAILATAHILVFYPHLFVVCSFPHSIVAWLLILSVGGNLVLLGARAMKE